MTTAIGLLIFIGIFALAIGLLGTFIGKKKVQLVVDEESRHLARQPWDTQNSRDRGNR